MLKRAEIVCHVQAEVISYPDSFLDLVTETRKRFLEADTPDALDCMVYCKKQGERRLLDEESLTRLKKEAEEYAVVEKLTPLPESFCHDRHVFLKMMVVRAVRRGHPEVVAREVERLRSVFSGILDEQEFQTRFGKTIQDWWKDVEV